MISLLPRLGLTSDGITSPDRNSPAGSVNTTPGSIGGSPALWPSPSMTSLESPGSSGSTPASCSLLLGEPDVTWTRLTDNFVEDKAFEGLTAEVRWHYLCLIQYCSRTGRYDGCVTRYNARYVSGSEPSSPDDVVAALVKAELLVESPEDGTMLIVRIDEHIPPPHMRDEQRKSSTRARVQRHRDRKRAEQTGENVTSETRYTRTGPNRPGPDEDLGSVTRNDSHLPPCELCGAQETTVVDEYGHWACSGLCLNQEAVS